MDNREKESYVKAGEINAKVKKFAREFIKPGMKLIDIANAIDEKIKELGAEPAFPVNLSLNEIAAHFTPDSSCEEVASGILKVDIGIHVNGYIADSAITLDFTENKEHTKLIEANKFALQNVMKKLKYDSLVKEVGETVFESLQEYNKKNNTRFSLVTGLSGHAVAQNIIHAGLTVPNYPNSNKTKLEEITIAIEPFFTTGTGEIYEGEGGGIFALKKDLPVRDKDTREVLNYIKEKFKTRPFCIRWLEKAGLSKLKFAMSNLVKQGILHHYPLLIERTGHPVSQFENTFMFAEGNVKITTFEEGWFEK